MNIDCCLKKGGGGVGWEREREREVNGVNSYPNQEGCSGVFCSQRIIVFLCWGASELFRLGALGDRWL